MEISYMILIVGGTFQGKKAFAEKLLNEKREDFTDGTSCAFSDIYHAKVLFHFHEYIRRMLEQEMSVQDLAEQLWMKNPDLVLISNTLSCFSFLYTDLCDTISEHSRKFWSILISCLLKW